MLKGIVITFLIAVAIRLWFGTPWNKTPRKP